MPVRQPYAGADFIPQLGIYELGYTEGKNGGGEGGDVTTPAPNPFYCKDDVKVFPPPRILALCKYTVYTYTVCKGGGSMGS